MMHGRWPNFSFLEVLICLAALPFLTVWNLIDNAITEFRLRRKRS
jgi:hypothetical protein